MKLFNTFLVNTCFIECINISAIFWHLWRLRVGQDLLLLHLILNLVHFLVVHLVVPLHVLIRRFCNMLLTIIHLHIRLRGSRAFHWRLSIVNHATLSWLLCLLYFRRRRVGIRSIIADILRLCSRLLLWRNAAALTLLCRHEASSVHGCLLSRTLANLVHLIHLVLDSICNTIRNACRGCLFLLDSWLISIRL